MNNKVVVFPDSVMRVGQLNQICTHSYLYSTHTQIQRYKVRRDFSNMSIAETPRSELKRETFGENEGRNRSGWCEKVGGGAMEGRRRMGL